MRKIYLIAGHNLTSSGTGTGAIGIIDEAKEDLNFSFGICFDDFRWRFDAEGNNFESVRGIIA